MITIDQFTAASKQALARLKEDLPTNILKRLKFSRVTQRHGTDTRILVYHMWDKNQPPVLNRQHLNYSVIFDPKCRYHKFWKDQGRPCHFFTRFYMNKRRGVYVNADVVIPAIWNQMLKAEKLLYGWESHQNPQIIALMHPFDAHTQDEVEEQVFQSFLELIPYWHGIYAAYCDLYGEQLTKAQVKAIIAGRQKFSPTGPRGRHNPEYSRHIPQRLRQQVYERDDHTCLKCRTAENLHADHIVPVAQGGLTKLDNLQTLCAKCNLSKGGLATIDYRN